MKLMLYVYCLYCHNCKVKCIHQIKPQFTNLDTFEVKIVLLWLKLYYFICTVAWPGLVAVELHLMPHLHCSMHGRRAWQDARDFLHYCFVSSHKSREFPVSSHKSREFQLDSSELSFSLEDIRPTSTGHPTWHGLINSPYMYMQSYAAMQYMMPFAFCTDYPCRCSARYG